MVQGYYTLQEAARHLNISLDELKMMAQKGKIRSFQDRGTLRFRIQDIQELARQRGITSDPDLVLGDASLPAKKSSGSSPRSPKSPASPKTPSKGVPEVFDFELAEDSVDLGEGMLDVDAPSKKGPGSGSKPKSGAKPRSGPIPQAKEPPPSGAQPKTPLQVKAAPPKSGTTPKSGGVPRDKAGSDSDVKLVASSQVTGDPDSDIRLREKSSTKTPASAGTLPKSGGKPGQPPTSDPTKKRASKLGPRTPSQPDSGVRLVAMDSDSDVKIVGGGEEVPLGQPPASTLADSNVKLEKVAFPPMPEDSGSMLTDEINLDEELAREDAALLAEDKPPTKVKPKSQLKFPTTSPFELSDSDLEGPATPAAPPSGASPGDSSDFEMTAAAGKDSSNFDLMPPQEDSGNFDLQAAAADSSTELPALKDDSSGNFELTPAAPEGSSEDDFSLELSDSSEVDLSGPPSGGEMSAPASGINLSRPIDAGISLEEQTASDDNLEFDLSLEPEATPKPAQMKEVDSAESSSEFELSLELDESEGAGKPIAAAGTDDSDSEFELTLDDSSGEMQADSGAAQVKAGDDEATTQDIFESDFEIPALEQEGGAAEPATVDTELESSDFDLALDDNELAADEESGSQVVALDEEEVEPAGEEEVEVTAEEEEGEFADLEGEEAEGEVEVEDTRPPREVEVVKLLKPAPWGVVPTIVMFPCVIVMLLVGLIGFEMVQSSVGHRPPGMMTRALADNVLVPLGVPAKFAK
jgi:excisionase family DNA binding protein